MIGIYKIESIKKPDRIYIGSAKIIHDRWAVHKYQLKGNRHHSIKLQRHYNKYGLNDLKFTVLLSCGLDDMIEKEQYFIDVYNPYFNVSQKAGSQLGRTVSAETREKIRTKLLGRKIPRDIVDKFIATRIKNHLSPTKGRKLSREHKAKISEGLMGRVVSDETRKKLSISNSGGKLSDEHKEKLRKAHLEYWEKKRNIHPIEL
jgi:group I intron endonuclease